MAPGKPPAGRCESRLDEQGRQRMATNCGHNGRTPEHPWPSDTIREHREEEVGRELGLHGPLRVRGRPGLLGRVGLPNVVRAHVPPVSRQDRRCARSTCFVEASLCLQVPECYYGLFPIRLRGDYFDIDRRCFAREDEFHRVDALRAALAHVLVHHRRV